MNFLKKNFFWCVGSLKDWNSYCWLLHGTWTTAVHVAQSVQHRRYFNVTYVHSCTIAVIVHILVSHLEDNLETQLPF